MVVPAFIIYRKSAEHVYENHPALYILAFGMVAAKVTNRLVVRILYYSLIMNCLICLLIVLITFNILWYCYSLLQVAHMTKNEMEYLDSSLIGPAMLFLNQYFNFFIKEYYVLWLCFVSFLIFEYILLNFF